MADNFRTLGRLLRVYIKMDFVWFFRDTRICLLYNFADIVVSLANVAGIFLLAARFEGFGGFSRAELLFMLGYALLVSGIYAVLLGNNNAGNISRIIGRGQLDHALIQPVPLPLHMLANGIAPISACGGLLCGIALTAYALAQLEISINIWLMVFLLLCSTAIMVAWVYAVSALAFWAPYAAEEISMDVLDFFKSLASYPLGGMPLLIQQLLCTVLPVGLMAFLPTTILLHKDGSASFGAAPLGAGIIAAVTAITVTISTVIFRKGLKYYAKHSSPRYSGFGRN